MGWRYAALTGAAAVGLVLPWMVPQYYVFLVSLAIVNAIVALGLNLLSGYTNQLSFGHAGFLAVGAYTASILTLRVPDLPLPLTLLVTGVGTGLIGIALGLPCLRLHGLYLAMATLAFGFVVVEAILTLEQWTQGSDGLQVPQGNIFWFGFSSDARRYYLVLATGILMTLLAKNLVGSRTGRAFVAIRESEIAAQTSGVNVAWYKTVAFAVSAFYTGVAGGLFAFVVGYISPDAFDIFLSVDFVAMIIIGGLGSIGGSLIGAGIVTLLHDWLAGFQEYRPLIFGAIMIGFMLFMPGGVVGFALRRRP